MIEKNVLVRREGDEWNGVLVGKLVERQRVRDPQRRSSGVRAEDVEPAGRCQENGETGAGGQGDALILRAG